MSKPTLTIRDNTEEQQVALAKQDPANFEPLYEKYFKRIFLFVHHRINDKAVSADITSQVFLKALVSLRKFKYQDVPFSAWLFRIALNECYDFFRKTSRYHFISVEDDALNHLHEELTADTEVEDLSSKLPFILEKLEQDEIYLLELRFFEHRPFKEVADILNITETYAKVKVYRLLDKMKKLFITVHLGKDV